MDWIEVALIIVGVGAFAGSLLIKERSSGESEVQQIDTELIRSIIEKEMSDAKERVSAVVDETLEYAVEKTERASERISNEKIMAISEYSDTVLADINKSHQEVMFLYDMLNDKHNNLKETVKHVDKTAKEAEEAANAAALALAAKAKEDAESKERAKGGASKESSEAERKAKAKKDREKEQARHQMARMILPMQQESPMHRQVDTRSMDLTAFAKKAEPKQEELRPLVVKTVEFASPEAGAPSSAQPTADRPADSMQAARPEGKGAAGRPVEVYSFAEQAPRVERPVKKEAQPAVDPMNMMKQDAVKEMDAQDASENNNDRILRLYKQGLSHVDIAKELGLGVGEVKLVINLFKGAV